MGVWQLTLRLSSLFFIGLPLAQSYEDVVLMERGNRTDCYNVPNLLTLSNGAPVDDKTVVMTAGRYGPSLLQDTLNIEENAFFNRERIPERFAHAKGAGAFGYFVVEDDSFNQYCKAAPFQYVGQTTRLAIRFSTAILESGSCDTVVFHRGAAVKLYSDGGNLDLVCLNTPVFPIRDPLQTNAAFHVTRRDPVTGVQNLTMFWDFFTLRQESAHQIMISLSDRAIPANYRSMHFYAGHAFKVVNHAGDAFFCKFHFHTNQGIRNLNLTEAAIACAKDFDSGIRDLYDNIAAGNYPSWTMYYQIMTFEQAKTFRWDPFDLTKIWPKAEFPIRKIGQLVLDRNPTNYFVDVEQAAYCPCNLIPGIEPSPDKMLHARIFAYADAQRYRLGVNHKQLQVNAARVKTTTNYRDGFACYGANQGGEPNYYPNSYGQNVCPSAANAPWPTSGYVKRYDTSDEDNFSQPAVLWSKVFNETQKATTVFNMANFISTIDDNLKKRVFKMFANVGEDLVRRVAAAVGYKGDPLG